MCVCVCVNWQLQSVLGSRVFELVHHISLCELVIMLLWLLEGNWPCWQLLCKECESINRSLWGCQIDMNLVLHIHLS